MRPLKKSVAVWVILSLIIGSWTLANRTNSLSADAGQTVNNRLFNENQKCDTSKAPSFLFKDFLLFNEKLQAEHAQRERARQERAKEVMQDNEYTFTGNEKGSFLENPLFLDGAPLEYGEFSLQSMGKLTVVKKASANGELISVPFKVHLRRHGMPVPLRTTTNCNRPLNEVEISEILNDAEQGDQLVIEAINAEDGAVKRILKLINYGC